jgi:glycosyltransferase involved in cell wall biosynthesis
MRLMILSDNYVFKNGGAYFSPDPWLKIAEFLAPFFSSVLLCVPLEQGEDHSFAIPLSESWKQKRIRWKHTFAHKTVINYYKLLPFVVAKNLPVLASAVRECDVVFMRLPAMNGYLTALVARAMGKPVVCYFSGDQRVQIFSGEKYQGPWAAVARMAAVLHDVLYQRIVRASNASLFEGDVTLKRFASANKNCFFMFPSMIEEHEIWTRPQSSTQRPARNILFVGSLDTAKGIRFLLEAMAHAVQSGLEYTLTICGDGPERNEMKQLTERLGLNHLVNFRGHVRWGTELTQVYREADILVHPSLSEGVPKVVLEAMANGVAIIATTVGGIPRVVTDGENGILVPPKSSETISAALKRVSQDTALRNRLVQGGYTFVCQHTAEKQARKLATIIFESVGKTQNKRARQGTTAKG